MIFETMKAFNKKQITTYIILFILLGSRMFLEGFQLVYLLAERAGQITVQIEEVKTIFPYLYTFDTVGTFGFVAAAIIINEERTNDLNIDKSFVVAFLYSGFAVFMGHILDLGCLTGVVWFFFFIYVSSGKNIKISSSSRESWRISFVIIGIFVVCLILAANFLDFFKTESQLYYFFLEAAPLAIYEELIFRGLLWKLTKDLQFSNSKSIFVQAFFFWFAHIHYSVTNPFSFWVFIPLVGLLLGYIVSRTKSITPSAIAHVLINFLVLSF